MGAAHISILQSKNIDKHPMHHASGVSACQRTYDLAPLIYEGGWPKAGGSQNICTANILKFPLF
jgi:hypothetical protein